MHAIAVMSRRDLLRTGGALVVSFMCGAALQQRSLAQESGASADLGKPLDLKEVADIRGQYEKLRDEQGFRLLDYAVDSDSATPRVCYQFFETLPKRAGFSPPPESRATWWGFRSCRLSRRKPTRA